MRDEEIANLLRQASVGDRAAADELIRRYEKTLRTAVRRRLPRALRLRVDTDDLVQSTFTLALGNLDTLQQHDERAFVAWLLTIARHRIGMVARHHRAKRRDVRRQRPVELAADRPNGGTSPSQVASRRDEVERVRAAIGQLESRDRELVELKAVRGLTYKEIAARLGMAGEDAARHRYAKVLRRVAERLASVG